MTAACSAHSAIAVARSVEATAHAPRAIADAERVRRDAWATAAAWALVELLGTSRRAR